MISQRTIEEIKSRIDIVEVISDYVTLKKSGKDFKATSPFSNEKTPSFFVVPAKGIFKDFSSGKGGDAITFLMEHEKMTYPEALKHLANKYGIPIEEETGVSQERFSERESLYLAMDFANKYFQQNLWTSEGGMAIGQTYLRERGFTEDTVKQFELGYAIDARDHFTNEALKSGFSKEILEKAGLYIKKEDGSGYDRFRGRVMFPIHDLSGRVVGLAARILRQDKNQPKYINSPETDIYHKSNILFGMYKARHAIRKQDECYLVEGYTDVMALRQAGIENVVASAGTSLTENQIKLIARQTTHVTVLFDGDSAGIKAALRGVDMLLRGSLMVRVVLLPEGEDPDSFSRKMSPGDLRLFLKENRKDFISFKVNLIAQESKNDPIKRAEAIRDIAQSISLIPDPLVRSVYTQETSALMSIDEGALISTINKILLASRKQHIDGMPEQKTSVPPPQKEPTVLSALGSLYALERETIRLLLRYSDAERDDEFLHKILLNELGDLKQFKHPLYNQIFEEFVSSYEKGIHLTSKHFLQNGAEEVKREIAGLLVNPWEVSPRWKEKNIHFSEYEGEKSIVHHVMRLKYRLLQLYQEEISGQLGSITDEHESNMLLDQLIAYKTAEMTLAKRLGIDVGKY